jgi:hypothetical protein
VSIDIAINVMMTVVALTLPGLLCCYVIVLVQRSQKSSHDVPTADQADPLGKKEIPLIPPFG